MDDRTGWSAIYTSMAPRPFVSQVSADRRQVSLDRIKEELTIIRWLLNILLPAILGVVSCG